MRSRIAQLAACLTLFFANAGPARADFAYQVYEGSWSQLPNFDAMTPVDSGLTPYADLSVLTRGYEIGLQFTGTLLVQQAGTYSFSTTSDEGSDLRIDGQLVVNNDPHYAVIASPIGSGNDVAGCGSPQWVDCQSSDPDSQWLTMNSLPGDITVRTTFTIPPAALLSSIALTGRWAPPGDTQEIRVNGQPVGSGSGGGWSTLSIREDDVPGTFAHGLNTLDFVVHNDDVAGGLRTDDLRVEALPEPRAWAAFGAGLALLALLRRRRGPGAG
jgi:PA14 domain